MARSWGRGGRDAGFCGGGERLEGWFQSTGNSGYEHLEQRLLDKDWRLKTVRD